MLHIYPMWIFYVPSIGTGTIKGLTIQYLIRPTSIWDFADEDPWKIFGFSTRGSNPGPPMQQASILPT